MHNVFHSPFLPILLFPLLPPNEICVEGWGGELMERKIEKER